MHFKSGPTAWIITTSTRDPTVILEHAPAAHNTCEMTFCAWRSSRPGRRSLGPALCEAWPGGARLQPQARPSEYPMMVSALAAACDLTEWRCLCHFISAGPQTYHLIASQNAKMQGFSCSDISEVTASLPLDAGWVAVGMWKSRLAPNVTLCKRPASELAVSMSEAQKKTPQRQRQGPISLWKQMFMREEIENDHNNNNSYCLFRKVD